MAKLIRRQWIDNLLTTLPPLPGRHDPQRGVFLEMKGQSYGDWRPAFDSSLILHNGMKNHTLTLVLKISYNQILPHTLPAHIRVPWVEAGTPPRLYALSPWEATAWPRFLSGVKKEAAKWNNKFWLVPPAHYSALDVRINGCTVRPNVYCHLHLEIYDSPARAYNRIDVINLDTQGVPANQQDNGLSRSNAARYDSLDTKNTPRRTQDETGKWNEAKNFSTIAHEIGHAIGLPHIGVTHQDPLCQIAVLLDQLNQIAPASTTLPALFDGGPNGRVCYGTLGKRIRGANVMGGGTSFEASNAAPWAQRLAQHTGTKPEEWKVAMKCPPEPKPV
jgi:hypothetical protein